MIRGWCPGALRPMPSGDGLIVRLKPSGGIVDTALAQRIAQWSRRWGNGQIDLSSRANLQLRGLSTEHLPALHDALAESGLLDSTEAGESVRNVITSPLAGLDPHAIIDVRPIAKSLEQRLTGDTSLHALPGKFGFAIDDSGLLALDEVPADIRFVACHGPAFTIHLAGAAHVPLGPCHADAVADVAATLAHTFLRHRERRMRDLVAAHGAEAIASEAELPHAPTPGPTRSAFPILGAHPLGSTGFLGVGLPFGRITAEHLAALASAAAAIGTQDLRLTPWRAILVPLPSLAAARALSAQLPTDAFILDPSDPRRRIAACPGAPACERATTPVRDDAASLAAAIAPGSGIAIHISGCEKGCAHPRAAQITLVGRNGRYDLVRDGAPSDPPALRGLSIKQATEQMR
jgi:precorrin-3B synthase